MLDQASARFHQALLQAHPRPVLDPARQCPISRPIGMCRAPRATFRSGVRWRPKLLQWEFLVGIGPDDQVGNVSFETRPPMWHASGDDDHIALGESTGHAALNALAPAVRPISEIRWPRRRRF